MSEFEKVGQIWHLTCVAPKFRSTRGISDTVFAQHTRSYCFVEMNKLSLIRDRLEEFLCMWNHIDGDGGCPFMSVVYHYF